MQMQHSQHGHVPIPQQGCLFVFFSIFMRLRQFPINLYRKLDLSSIVVSMLKGSSLHKESDTLSKKIPSGCRMKSTHGYCPRPLETASEFLSKKWTISIVVTIGNFKRLRFNDLLSRLERTTAKTLSARLKELEKEGIVRRDFYSEIPPRVEYSLTKTGKQLFRALHSLIQWAEKS